MLVIGQSVEGNVRYTSDGADRNCKVSRPIYVGTPTKITFGIAHDSRGADVVGIRNLNAVLLNDENRDFRGLRTI